MLNPDNTHLEPCKSIKTMNDSPNCVFEAQLIWETVANSRLFSSPTDKRRNYFLIKVFIGGKEGGYQFGPFDQALHYCMHKFGHVDKNPGLLEIKVDYITNDTVSQKNWLPKDLIDYLLDSDLHFILTHIHQGLTSQKIGWLIEHVQEHLIRLKYHPGFPTGNQIKCPIFTQDKYEYIKAIQPNSIPTYILEMVQIGCEFDATVLFDLKK
jgi:hypothetical protein